MSEKIDKITIRFTDGEVYSHDRLSYEEMLYGINDVSIEICIVQDRTPEDTSITPRKINMIFERSRIIWHEIITNLEE